MDSGIARIIELPPFGPLPFAHGSQSATARALACGHSRAGHARAGTRRQSRLTLISAVLALACVSACRPGERPYRVVDSEFMKFEELFSPLDTVRLDAAVLIGSMRFVDVSARGEFLITDDRAKAFHVFAATGNHVHTFTVGACNPEDSGLLQSARFLRDGSLIAATSRGVYALNPDGSCRKRLLELPATHASFCERQDLVYFLHDRFGTPRILAWSLELGIVEEYDLRMPEFPTFTAVSRGRIGRSMACFERGVFYRHAESMDAEPLWPGNELVTHRPTFFRPLRRDLITTDDMGARTDDVIELLRESTTLSGIFVLDEHHRLLTYQPWRETAFNIVNMELQTSVSTAPNLRLALAKHGLLYARGDYESLPSGEVGNQMIEIWQFHPFESAQGEVANH